MKLVVDVWSGFSDEDTLRIARRIMAEGSFSHPAYAELQGRSSRLVVEITGVVDKKYEALVPYVAPPLGAEVAS